MKTLFFTAGIPRSGSTLFQNIMAQNPDVYATPTSGLYGTLMRLKAAWGDVSEHSAYLPHVADKTRENAYLGLLRGYWDFVDQPYVLDKSRGWPSEIELLEALNLDVKIIVTIRNMQEVLASWELLHRNSPLTNKPLMNTPEGLTIEGRLKYYTSADAPIGIAFNRIKDAIARGHRKKLHFLRYEQLTHHPHETIAAVYNFLNIPPFDHDFQNIEQTVVENDSVWGFGEMHSIKHRIQPATARWFNVLGEAGLKYNVDWDKLIKQG